MGAWGAGLYSSDFALDLRATVDAVARLPLDGEALLTLLRAAEPSAADDPSDDGHTSFWLVVADQLHRRGIDCPTALERAVAAIDDGSDLASLERLGLDAAGLRKRAAELERLRGRLQAPPAKPAARKVLAKPQPLLLEEGGLYVYPTTSGNRLNPHLHVAGGLPAYWYERAPRASGPRQEGWGAFCVAARGLAFGYLAWYTLLVLESAQPLKPDAATLAAAGPWLLEGSGTCSQRDVRAMALERVGAVALDAEAPARSFPALRPGTRAAVIDRGIGNLLSALPYGELGATEEIALVRRRRARIPRVAALSELTATR